MRGGSIIHVLNCLYLYQIIPHVCCSLHLYSDTVAFIIYNSETVSTCPMLPFFCLLCCTLVCFCQQNSPISLPLFCVTGQNRTGLQHCTQWKRHWWVIAMLCALFVAVLQKRILLTHPLQDLLVLSLIVMAGWCVLIWCQSDNMVCL